MELFIPIRVEELDKMGVLIPLCAIEDGIEAFPYVSNIIRKFLEE